MKPKIGHEKRMILCCLYCSLTNVTKVLPDNDWRLSWQNYAYLPSCSISTSSASGFSNKNLTVTQIVGNLVFGCLELIVALMILWVGRIFSQSQHTRSAVIGEEQNWPNLLLDLIMKHWLLFADDFSPIIKSEVLLWIRNFSAPMYIYVSFLCKGWRLCFIKRLWMYVQCFQRM